VLDPRTSLLDKAASLFPKLSDDSFRALRDFIYDRTGIFFPEKKKYLIEGRVGKRLITLKLRSFEEYIQLLKFGQTKDEEFAHLCDAVTINETYFFRNVPQLDVVYQTIAPAFAKSAQANKPLRVWSAACSTGEEPYSVGIIYSEKIRPLYPTLKIELIGTDLNSAVLDVARAGEYNQYAMRNLPSPYPQKYFTTANERFYLKEEIKQLAKFYSLNLFDHQQMRRMRGFDIIFCANVLIYFDQKAKIQVVADLYNSLNYGGYLFIGSSELLHGVSNAFRVISYPQTTAYKKE
jgi:chemotaxis protein methyltransferase CheR